jgi:hypothetical protein
VRKPFGLTALPCLACVVALTAAVPSCDQTTHAQATGYVTSYVDTFEPRQLVVTFVDAADIGEAQAIVDVVSTDATVLSYNAGTRVGLVETPLGYSLDEISTGLEALTSDVVSAIPDYVLHADTFGTHMLVSEDGTRDVAWLSDRGAGLQAVAYEFIVRVHGTRVGGAPDGVAIMDVESVEITGDRVVQKGGALTLVDRSGDGLGTIAILVDDLRGEEWELVGTVAVDIAATVADGSLISVTGSELLPGTASRAGGLSMRAASYVVVTGEATARTVVTDALDDLTYDSGSDIWFVPIELASGSVVKILAEFGLPAESVTLDASGYLLFIDEAPGTAWPHTAQIVFVKTADPNAPVGLFTDRPATSLRIRDATGDEINGPWVVY